MTHNCHRNCIVPSNVLERLLEHKSKKIRAAALETMLLSERSRERRTVLGRMVLPGGGLNRTIYDSQEGSLLPGDVVRREGDPQTNDDAADEAYDGLGITYGFFKSEYGRDSVDDNGMRLDGSVHFGKNYMNAFWDGSQMVFGDGDGRVFLSFTKSLDVIAHELSHAVTEFTAGLVYHKQPGALNESFSDVFGSLVKQHHLGQTADEADWLIGNDIVGPSFPGTALRSMKDPGSAFEGDDQPSHVDDYLHLPDTRGGDWGGVHSNSGIPNRAFYLVASEIGGHSWERAGAIWYGTLLGLHRKSDFSDCASKSIEVATRRFGNNSDEHRAVREAWETVGVKVEGGRGGKGWSNSQGKSPNGLANLQRDLRKVSKSIDSVLASTQG